MIDPDDTVCVCCRHRRPHQPPACSLCRHRLPARLWELRDLHALLPAALAPGCTAQQRVSGSREVAVPLRLEPLDLAAPANQSARRLFARGVLGLDDTQVGSLSVATILETRTVDIAVLLEVAPPQPLVAVMVPWLSRHLGWAWSGYPDMADLADEITLLVYCLRTQLNISRKPIYLRDPCPSCGHLALKRNSGREKVWCGNCHRTDDDLDRLAVVLDDA